MSRHIVISIASWLSADLARECCEGFLPWLKVDHDHDNIFCSIAWTALVQAGMLACQY